MDSFLDFIRSKCNRQIILDFCSFKIDCFMDRSIPTIFSNKIKFEIISKTLNSKRQKSNIYIIDRNKCKKFLRKGGIGYDEIGAHGRLIMLYRRRGNIFIWLYDSCPGINILDDAIFNVIAGVFLEKGYFIISAAEISFGRKYIITPNSDELLRNCSHVSTKPMLSSCQNFLVIKKTNSGIFGYHLVSSSGRIRYIKSGKLEKIYFFKFSPLCTENKIRKVYSASEKRSLLSHVTAFHKVKQDFTKPLWGKTHYLLSCVDFYACLMGVNKRKNDDFIRNIIH